MGGYFSREVDFFPGANIQQLNSGITTIGFVLDLLDSAVFVSRPSPVTTAPSFQLFSHPTTGSFTIAFVKPM